ncbi:serine hydrolase domain-containing protein [Salisediminibacterium halotolerans]|uniref:CubicO group peptidase, beta-lactamase class C family n=1 Tax=Salisediminibacterium halotolerans TaxID=517425 RepID=A0A1H9SUS9_9BACI|nr:serine hydrolase domain-containing protein [Salisediminibacterium haloalkalitolerans]SER88752.1 CubicO group peptidase, beta-lactamase class C family [Salisediminibacterium haloalkalitolerans]
MAEPYIVKGATADGFAEVEAEFARNFTERAELGAACTIYYRGEKVVDLWGGYRKDHEPWLENTKVPAFSATKGAAAIALLKLYSEGRIDLAEKVASYWPAFSQNGKETITVRELITHQAGLVLLEDKLSVEDLYHPETVAKELERAKPLWKPGRYQGYHASTIGLFMSELVRRTDPKGRRLGQYFREEIAEPLALDFHIGLPETISADEISEIKLLDSVRGLLNIQKMPAGIRKVALNPTSLFVKSITVVKDFDPNDPVTWRAEHPSGNGIGTARSLACLYSDLACGGEMLNLTEETVRAIFSYPERPVFGYLDQVMNIETRYGLGFMKPDPTFSYSPEPTAAGFLGVTGSFAFADPVREVGYAYLTRKMGYYGVNDPREKNVREAMYHCIEALEYGIKDVKKGE